MFQTGGGGAGAGGDQQTSPLPGHIREPCVTEQNNRDYNHDYQPWNDGQIVLLCISFVGKILNKGQNT